MPDCTHFVALSSFPHLFCMVKVNTLVRPVRIHGRPVGGSIRDIRRFYTSIVKLAFLGKA